MRKICVIAITISLVYLCIPSQIISADDRPFLPLSKAPNTPLSIEFVSDEVNIQIERVDFWDGYIVFVGSWLANDKSVCISRNDFKLKVGNVGYDQLSRTKTRKEYGIEAPGTVFFMLCGSEGDTGTLLLPFAAPISHSSSLLSYKDDSIRLPNNLIELEQNTVLPLSTATTTSTPTPTKTPTPTPTFTPASVSALQSLSATYSLPIATSIASVQRSGKVDNKGIAFQLERIDFWPELPDNTLPSEDIFVAFTGILEETNSGESRCIGASNVTLHSGAQTYEIDNMRKAQKFYEGSYPGYILDQCVRSKSPVTTFFVFDVSLSRSRLYLSFHDAHLEFNDSLAQLAAEAGVSIKPTPTPTDTKYTQQSLATKAATATYTSTSTPLSLTKAATMAYTPTSTPKLSETRSGIVNSGANLRNGPSTSYEVVGALSLGDTVSISGTNPSGDWYQLENGNWIASFLVDEEESKIPTRVLIPTSNVTPTRTEVSFALTNTAIISSETTLITPIPSDRKSDILTKSDGVYRVGTEIIPGKWESDGVGKQCYWSRLDQDQNVIANHFGLSGGTITILESDYEVSLEDCGTWTYVENLQRSPLAESTTSKRDGFYTVGVEISPGKWESNGYGEQCYWTRLDAEQNVIGNHFGLSGGTITILESDYEVSLDDCGTWTYVEDLQRIPLTKSADSKRDGFYTVGVEIAVGTWESDGNGTDCYWERLNEYQEVIDNHFGLAGGSLTIRETDYEVRLEDCGVWTYMDESNSTIDITSSSTSSMQNSSDSIFDSGGLGLTKQKWEQNHTPSGEGSLGYYAIGTAYDRSYDVFFFDEKVNYIAQMWKEDNGVSFADAQFIASTLIPTDSQLIERYYDPFYLADTAIDLYYSESLIEQFPNEEWTGGEPGNFIVSYLIPSHKSEEEVLWIVISTGNNP